MGSSDGIAAFLHRVSEGVDSAIDSAGLDVAQHALLSATVQRFRAHVQRNPLADPLSLFYVVHRVERGVPSQTGVELAVFCQFYLLALDLFDDVQDQDLAGKPHAEAGAAVALNSALFLLFLGLAALERGMRGSAEGGQEYLSLVERVGLRTGRGQYRDLAVDTGATPAQVLEIAREKTASLALICELAAFHATPDVERRDRYRRVGENFSLFVQVLDDLRDIFGKRQSPDLERGRPSYPLACFLEHARPDERARFEQLRAQRPIPLRELRMLLYESGSVQRVAETLEHFRRAIYHEVSGLDRSSAWLRMLLFTVDGLAASVYPPQPIAEAQPLAGTEAGWHELVRRHARSLTQRLSSYDVPALPPLIPWHLPQWLYEPGRKVIYYADIEGVPEETLPFQAALFGETDLSVVGQLIAAQAPAVMAHELFHYYRDQTGRLGTDVWQEELAANSLAVAYCRAFEPEVLAQSVVLAERVLAQPHHTLSPPAARLLDGLIADPPRTPGGGYELPLEQMALVQMGMIRHLARHGAPLDQALQHWLGL